MRRCAETGGEPGYVAVSRVFKECTVWDEEICTENDSAPGRSVGFFTSRSYVGPVGVCDDELEAEPEPVGGSVFDGSASAIAEDVKQKSMETMIAILSVCTGSTDVESQANPKL